MTNDQSRLVLVVDSDQGFIDDARQLFAAQTIRGSSTMPGSSSPPKGS